ncbi:RimK family alpha-L-glutamate ligase [Kitasatospora sp. NPDC051853]|uniref:RimK family alpha-L-glutamate ligase n=1 Tax=Kitasatospora sp. NPDC051853 TaxID=3364058 RepID=UPI003798B500
MRVGVICRDPGHPLLVATAALLEAAGHRVEWGEPDLADPAEVYLLKARTPAALGLARELELRGSVVLNSAAATGNCQDREWMAATALAAGLPFVETSAEPRFPAVVKSRYSRKDDLVAGVRSAEELAELTARWPGEPVVYQPYLPGDGWDHKLWVVGEQVFGELRRSELAGGARESVDHRPRWPELALRAGEAFGLSVYGVDVLEVAGEPVVVDVNAFPGIRGQAGAPEALAELVTRR